MNFTKRCLVCGTKITVISSRHKYCGYKCYIKSKNLRQFYGSISMPVFFLNCDYCGKLYTRRKVKSNKYQVCSKSCSKNMRIGKRSAINITNCYSCKKVYVSRQTTNSQKHYCNDCSIKMKCDREKKRRHYHMTAITDDYILHLINDKNKNKTYNVPKQVIELKRNTIKLKRKIKNKQL